jgi:hypothetical protein
MCQIVVEPANLEQQGKILNQIAEKAPLDKGGGRRPGDLEGAEGGGV